MLLNGMLRKVKMISKINRGINLILLNVETEATIGLALRKEAEKS